MPPSIHLEPHLTTDHLEARYRRANDLVEHNRWQVLWLLARDMTATAAAAKLLTMAPSPDLSFLFTIPADDALAMVRSRDRPPGSAETEPLISRKIAAYEALARMGAFVVLDGLAEVSLVSRMVRTEVERMLAW